jgi:hypothetical protein
MAKENKQAGKEGKTVEATYNNHTPCHFDHDGAEYNLHFHGTYVLPDCDLVRSLIEQGRLTIKS